MEDELSLEEDTEFSGFGSDECVSPVAPQKTLKSVVTNVTNKTKGKAVGTKSANNKCTIKSKVKKTDRNKSSASTSTCTNSKSSSNVLDFSKLSKQEIDNLKVALGLGSVDVVTENDDIAQYGQNLDDLPNIHVQFDHDHSDNDVELDYNNNNSKNIGADFSAALFDGKDDNPTSEDFWDLPKLRAPEKGAAISQSLANLINTACSAQCDTDSIVAKYKLPENCVNLGAPLVNNELWKVLDKRARSQDRGMVEIQNLAATGIVPMIKLAEMFKTQISSSPEARTLVSDIMTIMGQVQYNLSLRRRYMIRPNINKKYSNLCNVNTPVSSMLFGDDISKEIKNCDNGVSLGKDMRMRGRGYSARPFRGSRGRGFYPATFTGGFEPSHAMRFTPYPQRGSYRGASRSFGANRRGRSTFPTATVTMADQSKN